MESENALLKRRFKQGAQRAPLAYQIESHRDRRSEPAGLHGLRKQVVEAKEGTVETGGDRFRRLVRDELPLPDAPLVASLVGFTRVQEKENKNIVLEKGGEGVLQKEIERKRERKRERERERERERGRESSLFICFPKAGIFGEVSWKDCNRIFISFLGVSFNKLIHQSEHLGSESWSLLIGWCQGRGSLVIASGSDASHGIAAFLGLELKDN